MGQTPETRTHEPSTSRELLHTRRLDFAGYKRSDGLFEIEGRVVDRKPHDFHHKAGRSVPANEPIHDLGVRIVHDQAMTVLEIETFSDATPYARCTDGGQALQSLKGLRMAAGWNRELRDRLSGARSCTHLMEILTPLATAALQAQGAFINAQPDVLKDNGLPRQIDSCYAYAAEGELVLKRWPQFHRPAED